MVHHTTQSHLKAVLQALFVVILWATSWVIIKIGLQDIPPLVFAGLRYFVAFICLLVVLTFRIKIYRQIPLQKHSLVRLLILGFFFYAVTQGASFVALAHLPAVTVNLLWSFSSIIIAIMGITWLSERPNRLQWAGVLLALVGALIYFYPLSIPKMQIIGLFAAIAGVLANAVSSILGRTINRSAEYHPLVVTTVSMGFGALVLLTSGVIVEGIPVLTLRHWSMIAWLALVNTAYAFTLWNHTLQTLTAIESSIINGTMLIWIPLLAILFLGERLSGKEIAGLVVAGLGTLAVQVYRKPALEKIQYKTDA